VVYDSVPATEYQETLNKAAALLRALDFAEEVEATEAAPPAEAATLAGTAGALA
jgi:hypothetical protein